MGLIGGTCVFAAHASAAPAPVLLRLSITGTTEQEWTHTAAPVQSGNCTRTVKSEGIRRVTFRTQRPVVVRLASGRISPADIHTLAGVVTLGGANTTDETCAGSPTGTSMVADCAQTRRSFVGARSRISSPRTGFVALGPVRNVRLAAADCPREPVEVIRQPLGPNLTPLRLPQAALRQRIGRMSLRASRTGRTTYGAPQAGTLEARVVWRLTFVRIS